MQMGGRVEYFTPETHGAGFRLTCFLTPAPQTTSNKPSEDEPNLVSGIQVLLAEDQPTLNKLTAKQLRVAGAQVTPTFDGVEALVQMDLKSFDVLLTDINMPNMNGYELTRAARAKGFKGLIFGVTAATIGQETDRLMECGADGVLSKPITMRALQALLREKGHTPFSANGV